MTQLPDCMIPDGGECCIGYQQLEAALREAREERDRLRRLLVAAPDEPTWGRGSLVHWLLVYREWLKLARSQPATPSPVPTYK